MKITYLDKPSYLPDWAIKDLSALGDLVIYEDKPSASEAVRRLSETDVAIVEWTEISGEMFNSISRLKAIVLVTTGYDFIDIEAAKQKNILVCNTPDYSRQSVAEHVFALFLSLAKNIKKADYLVRDGKTSYTDHEIGFELYNKTLGVLGIGSIGSWVAKIGNGFGMKVIGSSRSLKNIEGVKQVSTEELLACSDFIALCVSVNESTKNLLNKEKLMLLKPNVILVNISSNEILDENEIINLLMEEKIKGAGFDDIEDDRIKNLPNVVLTPGTAWYTQSSLDRNVKMFVETVNALINGKSLHVINP